MAPTPRDNPVLGAAALSERLSALEQRIDVLSGLLADLPQTSASTEVALEELTRARIEADSLRRQLDC